MAIKYEVVSSANDEHSISFMRTDGGDEEIVLVVVTRENNFGSNTESIGLSPSDIPALIKVLRLIEEEEFNG